jgi:hypothetical protein
LAATGRERLDVVESSLVLAERHVQDGRFRIVRQEALVERLRSRGHKAPLHEAREILELLYRVQEQFETHLERARAEDLRPASARTRSHLGRSASPR